MSSEEAGAGRAGKVAIVSPLPPAATGVADYSVTLQKELSRHAEVAAIDPASLDSSYDVCLYQIGNNHLHAATYDAALNLPGIVVLHDAVLHHFLLGRLSREQYCEEFVFNYGEWLRHVAEELWQQRALSAGDHRYFEYPMLRRVAESAKAVVVHNAKARQLACEALPSNSNTDCVYEIPHFVDLPQLPDESERTETRRRLGIPEDALVIGSFGYQRPSKRLRSLFQAARALRIPYRLLLVGDFVSPEYETALEPLMREAPAIRRHYVPEQEFWRLAALTDVCVNLRYPSAGETSGVALKLMAAGKPVLVTNSEENAAFPDAAVLRVDAGEAEVEMLSQYLCLLAAEPELRQAIGANAAEHVREHHSLQKVGRQYMEVIRRVIAS